MRLTVRIQWLNVLQISIAFNVRWLRPVPHRGSAFIARTAQGVSKNVGASRLWLVRRYEPATAPRVIKHGHQLAAASSLRNDRTRRVRHSAQSTKPDWGAGQRRS